MTDTPPPAPRRDQHAGTRPTRAQPARGRRLRIGAAATAAFVAGTVLGGTVLGGTVLGGTALGGQKPPDQAEAGRRTLAAGSGVLPVTDSGAVTAVRSCEELLAAYVDRGRDLVGPWGWGGPELLLPHAESVGVLQDGAVSGRAAAGAAEPRMRAATASATGTTVQEAGVDEPDVVKTDGRLLVRLDDDELSTWDVTGRDPERLGTLGVGGIADAQLLLVGDRAVVVGASDARARLDTEVAVVDLADPADPALVARSAIDARLVEARQHGGAVRLVTASALPDLDFAQPGDGRSESSALRENRRLVAGTDLDDWLPHRFGVGPGGRSGADRLLPCDAVGVPGTDGGLGTLAITTLLPARDEPDRPVAATGLLSASDTAYVSQDRIYVATAPTLAPCCWGPFPSEPGVQDPLGDPPFPGRRPALGTGDGATALHAFALEDERTTYVASGQVDGLVRERWWMDERGGVLRVAVAPTSATGNFSSVVTFTEDGDRLVEAGRLDKIGVDEDIQSVRWFDEMAVLVTFRRIDPVHVVDLTDETEPTMRGELVLPGFSAYLHPLGPRRILGIGEGPGTPRRGRDVGRPWGAQAALFDLADADDPRQVGEHQWAPGSVAGAASDPRQLTWLPAERVALTVVWRSGRLGRTGRVSVLSPGGGTLGERSVEVEYGDDVEDVRLVPLPPRGPAGGGGVAPTRVLLVTGDGVERFDLDG